jgi:hypothetical protein
MKYLNIIVIILCFIVISMGVAGYFVFKDKFLPALNSPQSDKIISQTSNEEILSLKSQMARMQRELNESRDILSKQSLFMQKLQQDFMASAAKIAALEKQGSDGIINSTSQAKLDVNEQPISSSNILLNPSISNELFKDPQFARIFQEQVAAIVQDIQKKQLEEQIEKDNEQLKQQLNQRTEAIAKNLNLNDYQKQEFSKILLERTNKTIELAAKLRKEELTPEEYKTKVEALRNEAGEKVKQFLLPKQYDQYKKAEPTLNRILQGAR